MEKRTEIVSSLSLHWCLAWIILWAKRC